MRVLIGGANTRLHEGREDGACCGSALSGALTHPFSGGAPSRYSSADAWTRRKDLLTIPS